MRRYLGFFAILASLSLSHQSWGNAYSCAKMIYKDGWLTKYEYKGETWGAGTKKGGILSSTVGSSIESVTSSVDPGVYTGQIMSSGQYSSSWGECSMLDYHVVENYREDYIDQNLSEIKKQLAVGEGIHVDSLAYLSGCSNIRRSEWSKALKGETAEFYDSKSSKEFTKILDRTIRLNPDLSAHCRLASI